MSCHDLHLEERLTIYVILKTLYLILMNKNLITNLLINEMIPNEPSLVMQHFSGRFITFTFLNRQTTPNKRKMIKCITITLIETVANNHLIRNSNKFQLYAMRWQAGLMKQVVCVPFDSTGTLFTFHFEVAVAVTRR